MTHPSSREPVHLVVLGVTTVLLATLASSYNVSPVPNVVFSKGGQNSSYFGYALHLKRDAVFVGAPRSQSGLRKQTKIDEPGAIFRCDVSDGSCVQYELLDSRGQDLHRIKSGQRFGASMDGIVDNEDLVGCAPRFVVQDAEGTEITKRAMTGICYARVNNATKPLDASVELHKLQSKFDYASEGFSVHITQRVDNGLEIMTGAPFHSYSGAVIIYAGPNKSILQSLLEKPGGYFGYSVNSMVVQNKTIYVASAPRSNGSPGKVLIFETKVQKKQRIALNQVILQGDEIRDYFGYSLCTEDINGDGLPDVLVGAPYYSKNAADDHGAVFVFLNRGFDSNETLIFERQLILVSNYDGSGYFGYSIASIGDINNDGFNDIAIGAPFEAQGGAVYIHHGSATGINPTASQTLNITNLNQTNPMFGASIARAVDIDGNYYNDIVVGAPIEDRVFLFRTYPIVRPRVSMSTSVDQINLRNVTGQTVTETLQLEICYQHELIGDSESEKEFDFEMTLSVDAHSTVKRASTDDNLMQLPFSTKEQCISKTITVDTSFYHLDRPIVFELSYKLINQNTSGENFCDNCAILEQSKSGSNLVKHSVFFGKECDNDECKVDLKLRSVLKNFNTSLVMNSTKTLEVSYEIANFGDVAYGTKLLVNFSQSVNILKKSESCVATEFNMTCNINNGRALRNSVPVVVDVTLDGTALSGDRLVISTQLSSSGKELADADNSFSDVIELRRFSDVVVHGIYNPSSYFDIDKQEGSSIVKSILLVENLGPSSVQNVTVSILIPEMFDNGAKSCPLIKSMKSLKILNGDHQYDFTNTTTIRASTSQNDLKPYNQSTYHNLEFLANKNELMLSCHHAYVRCWNVSFHLTDFAPSSDLLQIELELDVRPKALLKLFNDSIDTMVSLFLTVDFVNPGQSEIHQTTRGSMIFYRSAVSGVPMWVYVVSVLLGALILAVITHLLRKRQFFKRMTQSDMELKLHRENSKKIAYTDGSVMMICDSTANILQ